MPNDTLINQPTTPDGGVDDPNVIYDSSLNTTDDNTYIDSYTGEDLSQSNSPQSLLPLQDLSAVPQEVLSGLENLVGFLEAQLLGPDPATSWYGQLQDAQSQLGALLPGGDVLSLIEEAA